MDLPLEPPQKNVSSLITWTVVKQNERKENFREIDDVIN